jgi:hypothetical protein
MKYMKTLNASKMFSFKEKKSRVICNFEDIKLIKGVF